MTNTGEWAKGVHEYHKDWNYIRNYKVLAFVRPSGAQWLVYECIKSDTSFRGWYDDLETAKAVAVALVAMT